MSSVEDRLREAYLAAADLVADDAVPARPPTPRRFSGHRAGSAFGARSESPRPWRIAALAAAGVTAIAVTLGVGMPRLLSEQRPRPVHTQSPVAGAQSPPTAPAHRAANPGLPEFVVVSSGTGLEVMQSATGHVTAQVATPAGQIFARIAGDGSDRVFYAAAQQADPMATCRTYFYRFSLSAAGQPSALTPLLGGQAGLPTALAASADGSKLAFSLTHCADGATSSLPLSQASGYIGMLDTISGTITRTWTFNLGEDYATSLTLTPDGSQLVLAQYQPDGSVVVAKKLATDAPSGTVDQASTVVGLPGVSSVAAGADLYGCIATDTSPSTVANQLGVYDVATGHRSAVVHTWTGSEASCSLAPNAVNGNVLVAMDSAQAPGQSPAVLGNEISVLAVNVSTGQLTTLLTTSMSPSDTGVLALVAW